MAETQGHPWVRLPQSDQKRTYGEEKGKNMRMMGSIFAVLGLWSAVSLPAAAPVPADS